MSLSQQDLRKLQRAMAHPKPCLLCGVYPPVYIGLFEPKKPELWGGQLGKGQLLVYALCARFKAPPSFTEKVEARIMASMVGRRN
jgi:hypothetical protein